MPNVQSISPCDTPFTTPEIDGPEQQGTLPVGPVVIVRQRPTGAQLREAMTALGIHGTARNVAYELLTYWSPGCKVFPSVGTLAEGLGYTPRTINTHLARLEQIGLWVRQPRTGRTNIYEMRLPGPVSKPGGLILRSRGVILRSGVGLIL